LLPQPLLELDGIGCGGGIHISILTICLIDKTIFTRRVITTFVTTIQAFMLDPIG
jgi:hypothetical protein